MPTDFFTGDGAASAGQRADGDDEGREAWKIVAKYTIEVNTLYCISILAPLAVLIEEKEHDGLGLYMADALSTLFSEFDKVAMIQDGGKKKWLEIADSAEEFASFIRNYHKEIDESGEA